MIVLIEGLGAIAQKHIIALKTLVPNVVIYGLRSSENANKIEGVMNVYSYEHLPSKPDFVIICNPTQFHRESVRRAIKLGVPLMIEKPVFHTVDENDLELIKEIEAKNIKTYIACNLRFHAILIKLKQELERHNRRINEVTVYCGSYFPDWRPNRHYKDMYSAKNEAGGGIHLELIHELDYTCWLLGIPQESKRTLASKSSINISAPDYANYLLEYKDFFASITLNFYRRKIKRSIEVVFDDETWNIDLINSTISNDNNEVLFSSELGVSDTYQAQIQHMIDIVNNNVESINTIQNSMEVLKICLKND